MWRTSHIWCSDVSGVSAFEFSREEVKERLKSKRESKTFLTLLFSQRITTSTRYIVGGGVLGMLLVYLIAKLSIETSTSKKPHTRIEYGEIKRTSPEWWENEWRKGNTIWRTGESTPDFYKGSYAFIKSQTGRDLSSAKAFVESHPRSRTVQNQVQQEWLTSWITRLTGHVYNNVDRKQKKEIRKVEHSLTAQHEEKQSSPLSSEEEQQPSPSLFSSSPFQVRPRVLVPLSGDSPIMHTMINQGYEVFAIDCSETAIRSAVDRIERSIEESSYDWMHLIWSDFFKPELWSNTLQTEKFDIIYERQGMTSLNREERKNYAYLLKKVLKDDGVMYVEGIFRTGRVKGNKVNGPPYSLSKRELEHLFPEVEGFFVRCEEKSDAMIFLDRESRLLGRIPRNLYITPFHCVVFKEESVNLTNRSSTLSNTASMALL